jgi:hypothetical protein
MESYLNKDTTLECLCMVDRIASKGQVELMIHFFMMVLGVKASKVPGHIKMTPFDSAGDTLLLVRLVSYDLSNSRRAWQGVPQSQLKDPEPTYDKEHHQ